MSPGALRRCASRDELVAVEPVEKGSDDFLGRELGADQTLKALVRAQDVDVADAVAACGHQQHDAFRFGAVRRTVVALTEAELCVQIGAHTKLAHRLEDERKSRVRRHRIGVFDDFDRVGEEARLARHDEQDITTNAYP